MIRGVPDTGSGSTRDSRPNTSRTSSSVTTVAGGAFGHDPSALHGDDVVRVPRGEVEVVQHDRHGGAALAVEVRDEVQDFHLVGEVQVGGGLIQQQHFGFLGQGHRDPHALPLPAGEFVDVPPGEFQRFGGGQRVLHRALVLRRAACRPGPEEALVRVAAAAHEVPDGDAVRRRGMLREQAQGARHFAGRTAVDVLAVQGDRAGGGLEQPGQAAEQGGFAAGVGADNHGHLALGDFRAEPLDHGPLIVFQRQVRGSEELPCQASFRLEVTSSQSRNGAPRAPVMTPTGRTVPSSSSGAMLAAT